MGSEKKGRKRRGGLREGRGNGNTPSKGDTHMGGRPGRRKFCSGSRSHDPRLGLGDVPSGLSLISVATKGQRDASAGHIQTVLHRETISH